MTELDRLWYFLDPDDFRIRPRYICSASDIWADNIICELDTDD
jgi:hypothetical protein